MGSISNFIKKKRIHSMNYLISNKKATTKPTWSDEPLTEAVWERAAEFGSVFWVPWAILDRVVTYKLNRKITEIIIIFTKEVITNLHAVYNAIKDCSVR